MKLARFQIYGSYHLSDANADRDSAGARLRSLVNLEIGNQIIRGRTILSAVHFTSMFVSTARNARYHWVLF